jgi:hypothetical protein
MAARGTGAARAGVGRAATEVRGDRPGTTRGRAAVSGGEATAAGTAGGGDSGSNGAGAGAGAAEFSAAAPGRSTGAGVGDIDAGDVKGVVAIGAGD